MRDPFRQLRARSLRTIRRSAVAALTGLWGAALAPAKPRVRKPGAKAVKPLAGKASKAPLPAKPGAVRAARMRKGTYLSALGARPYRLYVPLALQTGVGPFPLIVMLHGCSQTAEDFARGTGMNALADQIGFLVLYPAQTREAQFNRCWNWFKRDDQGRGGGETALIADLVSHVISEHAVDPARVYVAGLSAGAAMALNLATAYPDIFAAVGVHSGLAAGAAHDAASAARAMQFGDPGQRHATRMPTIIFHGAADTVVNPRNGRFVALRALEPYEGLDRSEKAGSIKGGREYTRTRYRVGRGRSHAEHWVVHGAGHAWSGGRAGASHTDPGGPDASREMVRFFLAHRTTRKRRLVPAG